ncbi:MAG: c-type cytochrome [Rudaea sp.]|nr:c-type cytochrome [Rudaea sp.]
MSFRYVIGMAVLLGAGVAQAADKPIVGDATAGAAKAATCGACHGADGNPAMAQYPKLAGQGENYIARQTDLIKTGKRQNPVMVGFVANLSLQDMHDIGAFYATKTSLPGVADQTLVARGQALYRGGNADSRTPACMACHGPDGRGNPGAMYPQLGGQFADYTTAKLKAFRDGQPFTDDEHGKIMTSVAKPLSDADIAALASYIEGLHAATPKTAEVAK